VSFELLDVRDPTESERVVQKVTAERGKIDVWVNNAVISHTAQQKLFRESGGTQRWR